MAILNNIKVSLGRSLDDIVFKADPEARSYRILKKSLDARKKSNIHHVYNIQTFTTEEPPALEFEQLEKVNSDEKPMVNIIGAGPAGLFAALRLIERGIPCRLIERGKPVTDRMRDISRHWKKGIVDPDSNVCFGEGGAGTFSDGKLITRVKSPYIRYVMEQLVRFGAPEEILYLSNPHVGSNKIRKVIHALTEYLKENDCDVRFETRAENFEWSEDSLNQATDQQGNKIDGDVWVMATGHSAHDVFEELFKGDVPMEAKSMAMGFRVEHPQTWVNQAQYGSQWERDDLPDAANYKLTCHDKRSDIGVYSFCMCPGGYVLASSAQPEQMVCNGMSNYNHGSGFANSGIVITIDKDEWYPEGPKQALAFQTMIEKKTFNKVQEAGGTVEVPAQKVKDFIENKTGEVGRSSCPSGVIAVNMRDIYPKKLTKAFVKAMKDFERKMPGFIADEALLHGVESRTSSPIRVLRDKKTLVSPKYKNLYPAGEGAGFAGGITSAAADGVRIAEAIIANLEE